MCALHFVICRLEFSKNSLNSYQTSIFYSKQEWCELHFFNAIFTVTLVIYRSTDCTWMMLHHGEYTNSSQFKIWNSQGSQDTAWFYNPKCNSRTWQGYSRCVSHSPALITLQCGWSVCLMEVLLILQQQWWQEGHIWLIKNLLPIILEQVEEENTKGIIHKGRSRNGGGLSHMRTKVDKGEGGFDDIQTSPFVIWPPTC